MSGNVFIASATGRNSGPLAPCLGESGVTGGWDVPGGAEPTGNKSFALADVALTGDALAA